jgi:hypothetical protein
MLAEVVERALEPEVHLAFKSALPMGTAFVHWVDHLEM